MQQDVDVSSIPALDDFPEVTEEDLRMWAEESGAGKGG